MNQLHLILGMAILLNVGLSASQHPTMPAGMPHEEHLRQLRKDDALKKRGALAMGFDQDKTVHNFLLTSNGGEILVDAKSDSDAQNIALIRSHIQEIASSFAAGVFDKPFATHEELPPGAATLTANKGRVTYRYQERATGASVVIETVDPVTLKAVHEFLRYQIVEHKTSDPLVLKK